MHDEHYKRLFGFPRLVEDLLRGFVRDDWIDDVDFSTLDKLPAEYVGDGGRIRRGDAVWRVRQRDDWLHVLILLEFQSTDDPDMALRIMEYTALLFRELRRNGGPWTPTAAAPGAARGALQRGGAVARGARGGRADPAGPAVAGPVSAGAAIRRA